MGKPSRKLFTKKTAPASTPPATGNYTELIGDISVLLETTRRQSIRVVNAFMTATYWEIGRRIVEHEQGGEERAEYGESLMVRLSSDLGKRFGRGFSRNQLFLMRKFYLSTAQIFLTVSGKSSPEIETIDNQQIATGNLPAPEIFRTVSGKFNDASILQTPSSELNPVPEICSTLSSKSEVTPISQTVSVKSESLPFALSDLARIFPLPWSHYVLLTRRSRSPEAFSFYHTEALRGGWSVRQLQRQIRHHRPEARRLHPRRLRTNAPLPELRSRTLDATQRKPTRRHHPLLAKRRITCPLHNRRAAQQTTCPRLPDSPARRKTPRRRTRPNAQATRKAKTMSAKPKVSSTNSKLNFIRRPNPRHPPSATNPPSRIR